MIKEPDNPWIDVSTAIQPGLVVWPGDPVVELSRIATLEKDGCNVTHLSISAHTGTHLDAPYHYLANGTKIDEIEIDRLLGLVRIISIKSPVITAGILSSMDIKPKENIIFKTSNSATDWQMRSLLENYVYLDESAAEFLVGREINLTGVDYLSIGHPQHGGKVHQILMQSGVLILEGLVLRNVSAGNYEMICLPLKIRGADGAPARVLLRKLGPEN